MSFRTRTRRLPDVSWIGLSLLLGATILAVRVAWEARGLDVRVVRDVGLYVLIPGAIALVHGRDIGWRVDRRAVRHAIWLALFVLPFYLVGSSLPTIRAFYPMWGLDSTAPAAFLPHAGKQFLVVIAAETYYRGLLCVGLRDVGFGSVFVSPVVYTIAHAGKPPIELALSGPTDVLFGAVDYRCESILPSVVAHGLGLCLLDWLVLRPPFVEPSVVTEWLSWLPVSL